MDFESVEQKALEEAAGGHPTQALTTLQEACENALQEAGALSRPVRLQVLIAQLRMDTGDLNGARTALLDAFPGLRGPDGSIQADVADRMARMLMTMVGQSEAGEAAQLLDQLVELRKLQFGEHHPMTLAALHRKAELLYEQGAFRLAEQAASSVVELRERVLGLKNPLSGASSVLYARTLEARQKPSEAFLQYARAYEILSSTLGDGHAQTQMARQNRERLKQFSPAAVEPPPAPEPRPEPAAPPKPAPAEKASSPAWPLSVPGGLWQPFDKPAEREKKPVEPPKPVEREAPRPAPPDDIPARRPRVQASWAGEGPVSWFGERSRPREAWHPAEPEAPKPAPPPRAEFKPEPSLRDDSRTLIQKHAQTEQMRTETLFSSGSHRNLQIVEANVSGAIQASQHMIVHGRSALLLDPGGPKVFPRVLSEVLKALGREAKLEHILLSHQDPDCVSAVNSWMMTCEARMWLSALWHRFVPHFGLDRQYWGRLQAIPDDGLWIDLDGAPVAFLPAHFLHSAGNFHVWDPTARILYTGDFAACPEDEHCDGQVEDLDRHLEGVLRFHGRYMVSNRAIQPWVRMVSKLDVEAIVPHHGPHYRGPQVARFLDWCVRQKVGMDLMPDAYAMPAAR